MTKCVYCGNENGITKDHIPPKALFAKPRPHDLITVPACEKCNSGFNLDDDYFKTMHLLRRESAGNDDVKRLLPKLYKSMKHVKASSFSRRFQKSISLVEEQSRFGLYLGKSAAFTISNERFSNTIERCIYGLHYFHFNQPLYEGYKVHALSIAEFNKISPILTHRHLKIIDTVTLNPPLEIGKGRNVFKYWFKKASDSEKSSFWIISIYEKTFYIGIVLPEKPIKIF